MSKKIKKKRHVVCISAESRTLLQTALTRKAERTLVHRLEDLRDDIKGALGKKRRGSTLYPHDIEEFLAALSLAHEAAVIFLTYADDELYELALETGNNTDPDRTVDVVEPPNVSNTTA